MADYFAILKRAVGALPEGSREQRQAIYDKARKALLAQLQQMDPPLAPSEISKQRVSLEEAIRSVELDLSKAKETAQDTQESHSEPSSAPASRPQSDGTKSAASSPSSAVSSSGKAPAVELNGGQKGANEKAAEKLAPVDLAGSKEPQKVEVVSTKPEMEIEPAPSPADKVVRRAGQDVLKNAVRDANALGDATSAAVKSAQETADIVGEKRDNEAARIEPTLGDAVVSNAKTYKREKERQAGGAETHVTAGPSVAPESEKQSQTGLLMAVLLLAGGLGASAYLLYQNKDAFLGEETGVVADVDNEKVSTNPDVAGTDAMPSKTVRTVVVTPDGVATTEPAEAEQTVEEDGSSSQTPSEANQVQAGGQEANQPSEAVQPGLPVAQRSIFYEEESAGSKNGRATSGQAVWSLEGQGDDATIKVEVAVPDRNVGFSISLKKNVDPELPASHLIEVVSFHNNPDEPRIIDSIPGLILKPTEQSRGVGLAGAAIRIADDMYWIALKSEAQAIKYNMELLVLRSWIDMPILYKSGRRAILTLEKGDAGDSVIKQALVEWGLLQKTQ